MAYGFGLPLNNSNSKITKKEQEKIIEQLERQLEQATLERQIRQEQAWVPESEIEAQSLDTLVDVLERKSTKPQQIVYSAQQVEAKAPNYLLYIGLGIAAIFIIKKLAR